MILVTSSHSFSSDNSGVLPGMFPVSSRTSDPTDVLWLRMGKPVLTSMFCISTRGRFVIWTWCKVCFSSFVHLCSVKTVTDVSLLDLIRFHYQSSSQVIWSLALERRGGSDGNNITKNPTKQKVSLSVFSLSLVCLLFVISCLSKMIKWWINNPLSPFL